jgi:hypothetical protein
VTFHFRQGLCDPSVFLFSEPRCIYPSVCRKDSYSSPAITLAVAVLIKGRRGSSENIGVGNLAKLTQSRKSCAIYLNLQDSLMPLLRQSDKRISVPHYACSETVDNLFASWHLQLALSQVIHKESNSLTYNSLTDLNEPGQRHLSPPSSGMATSTVLSPEFVEGEMHGKLLYQVREFGLFDISTLCSTVNKIVRNSFVRSLIHGYESF